MRNRWARIGLLLACAIVLTVSWSEAQIGLSQAPCPSPQRAAWGQIITDITAATNGQWINVRCMQPITFAISLTGETVTMVIEVDGDVTSTQPLNTVHGFKLNASDITASTLITVDQPLDWVKVRTSAYTAGTINVWMLGYLGGP